MKSIVVERSIDAPVDLVFRTLADIDQFSRAVKGITKIEYLTAARTGVGTRYRETRRMNGKDAAYELEVREYVPNQRVRIVSEAGGTTWDSVTVVQQEDGRTMMTLTMDAISHKLLPNLINLLIRSRLEKAVEEDMNSVKSYCEHAS